MRRPESHFENHPGVRSGIFYFLFLMFILQGVKWGVSRVFQGGGTEVTDTEATSLEHRLDSIRTRLKTKQVWTLRPMDPNDLEDYKGYLLGISFEALDSIYAFRSRGGHLMDMEQFQRVTGLPDSTCLRVSPFFRFPRAMKENKKVSLPRLRDLNTASAEQLQVVRGIGPVLSKRIVRFREALGGFITSSQLLDVYGLKPEIAQSVAEVFPLRTLPVVHKVDINQATLEDLSAIAYLNREMAGDLIAYRKRIGRFRSLEELHQVLSLPKDRIDRIALYLQL